jgi:hypothetical protein
MIIALYIIGGLFLFLEIVGLLVFFIGRRYAIPHPDDPEFSLPDSATVADTGPTLADRLS